MASYSVSGKTEENEIKTVLKTYFATVPPKVMQ